MSIRVTRHLRENSAASQSATAFDRDLSQDEPLTLGSDPHKCNIVLKGLAGRHCTLHLEPSLAWVSCTDKGSGRTFLVTSDSIDPTGHRNRIRLASHSDRKERLLYQLRQGDRLVLSDGQGGDWEITLTSLHGNRRRSSDGSFNFGGGTQAYCPAKKKRQDFDTYSEGSFSDRTLSPNENERHRANAMAQEEEDSLPPGLDETMKFSLGEQGQSLSPVVPLLLTSGEVNPEDVFGGRDSLASLASFGEGSSIPAIRPSTPAADPRASIATVPYCPGTTYKDTAYQDSDQDSDTRPYGERGALKAAPTRLYGHESESAPPTPVQDSCIEDAEEEISSLTPKASTGVASVMAKTRRVQPPDEVELVCSMVDEAVNPNDFPLNMISEEEGLRTGMTISTDSDGDDEGDEMPSRASVRSKSRPQPKPKAKSKAKAKAKAKGRPKAKARGRRSPQSSASKRSRRVKVEDDCDVGSSSIEAPRSPVSKRRRRQSAANPVGDVMKEEDRVAICFSTECRPSAADERRIAACGGRIAASVSSDVAMFVADRLKRTAKLMSAICRGIPVVSSEYILRCFERGQITQPYDETDWLQDAAGERSWGFTLSQSIKLARDRGPVLKDYQVHCATKATATKDFKEIVAAAGGTYLTSLPARIPEERKDSLLVIVEDRETRGDLRLVRKLKLPSVYVKELVMAAATTQELDLVKFTVEI